MPSKLKKIQCLQVWGLAYKQWKNKNAADKTQEREKLIE